MGADLTLAQGLITQYQTDLAGAPAMVIGELDSAVSDVQQNEQAILTAIHVYDPTTQAAISASIAAIDTVLLGLESAGKCGDVLLFRLDAGRTRYRSRERLQLRLSGVSAISPPPDSRQHLFLSARQTS